MPKDKKVKGYIGGFFRNSCLREAKRSFRIILTDSLNNFQDNSSHFAKGDQSYKQDEISKRLCCLFRIFAKFVDGL